MNTLLTAEQAWEFVKATKKDELNDVLNKIEEAARQGKTEIEVECSWDVIRMTGELGFRGRGPRDGVYIIYW